MNEKSGLSASSQSAIMSSPFESKPYYEADGITIYHGNCADVLPFIRADVVLTDPPYNIGFRGYHSYSDKLPDDRYIALLASLKRFSKLIVMQYPEETQRYLVPALGPADSVIAWCYNANTPRRFRLINFYGHRPKLDRVVQPYKNLNDKRIQQLIARGSKGTPVYEWWSDIQLVKNVNREKTGHPCQMPLMLVERLMTVSAERSNVILDPFMGAGSTLVAARNLGLNAIGIEIDERYCEIAANRLRSNL